MKTKFLLQFIFLLSTAAISNAQVKSGKALLGGSINLFTSSNTLQKSFYSNILLGKVIKDNTVIGVIGSYSSNNYNSITYPIKMWSYSAGVFYRRYTRLAQKFYLFGEADASYSYSKNILEYYSNSQDLNSKSSGISVSFVPGIAYNVWKKLQVELSMPSLVYISYLRTSTIDSYLPPSVSPQKKDAYNAGVNLNSNLIYNFSVGFKFIL